VAVAQESRMLGVDELFALAKRNSKAIRVYETALEESRARVTEAKNGYLPSIGLFASATYLGDVWLADRNFSHGQMLASPHFGNSLSIEAAQVIFAGGAIRGGVELAKLRAEMARLDLESQQSDVRLMLVAAYLDLYKCRNMVGVYGKNIEQARQMIMEMRAKEKAGIVLSKDIVRYELQLQNLIYARTQLLGDVAILNNTLVTTLGLSNNIQVIPDTALLAFTEPAHPVLQWSAVAMENALALKKGGLGVKINEHMETLTQASRYPQIALIAGDRFNGPITYEVPAVDKNVNAWYVGVSLNYAVDNLYKKDREASRSRIATKRAQQESLLAQEQVGLAVHAAEIKYQDSFAQLRTQEQCVNLAKMNFEVISNHYKNDLALMTDLIDASNALLSAEMQFANARIHIVYNYYQLRHSAGTL
jgi:outer membrane protein